MKERLRNYSRLLAEIEILERRCEAVEGISGYRQKTARKGILRHVEALKVSEQGEREKLAEMLNALHSEHQRQVILARYFDGHSWAQITALIFGNKPDFLERAESYMRRVFRIHGNALAELNKIGTKK